MEYPKNNFDFQKNIPKLMNNFDIKSESASNLTKEEYSNIILNGQTEIIFNATNSNKSHRKRNFVHSSRGKLKKYTRVIRKQKIHLKRKRQGSSINKNLASCCNKEKTKYTNQKLLHRLFCSNSLSKTISRTRVLKKVLAKENLLEGKHTPDTMSFRSGCSQDTLTREDSESSHNKDNTRTLNSVIEIPLIEQRTIPNVFQLEEKGVLNSMSSDGNKTSPYKTDVMNVAVAKINKLPILDFNNEQTATGIPQMLKQSLTSAESFESQSDTIHSDTSASFLQSSEENSGISLNNMHLKEDGKSSATLIGGSLASESDNFIIASNSYFKEQCNSDKTLMKEPMNDVTKPITGVSRQDLKPNLLDTNINMGMFPMASENESANVNNDLINVIVIGQHNKIQMNRLDDSINGKVTKNVTQKSFSIDNSDNAHKIILPNENTIKEILTESEKSQKKTCSEESRNYAPVIELWEKLALFLDITMKRIEETLLERIRRELKDAVSKFEHLSPVSEPKTKSQPKMDDLDRIEIVHSKYLDKNLQCGLIQNEMIDELLVILNNEELESLVKKKNENSLEVIKPPIPRTSKVRGQESIKIDRFKNRTLSKYRYLSLPFRFIRENMLVIVSAPLFCFSMFLIYSLLVIIW